MSRPLSEARGESHFPRSRLLPILVPMTFGLVLLALAPLHHSLTFSVEIDFPRYAGQADSLPQVLTWEQFTPLGYPFLLWLLSRAGLSVFAAGKVIAGVSAVVFLFLVYPLARWFLPAPAAVLVQLFCAVNWHLAQYGLLCGTDLPWATVQLASFLLLFRGLRHADLEAPFLAGLVSGLAYELRYQTLIAVPWMAAFFALAPDSNSTRTKKALGTFMLLLGFFIGASPQLALNLSQQHRLFPTGHAKNVWMGIYGQGNWAKNWTAADQHDNLREIIQQDQMRFFRHWTKETAIAFLRLPFLALGLQPVLITQEPGPGLSRLFLFLLGLLGLGALFGISRRGLTRVSRPSAPAVFLAVYTGLYCAVVALAFTSFRFLLPLVPFAALAVVKILRWLQPAGTRKFLAPVCLSLVMVSLSCWGFYVTLERFQCRDQEVVQALNLAETPAGVQILSNRPELYRFHLPVPVQPLPIEIQTPEELQHFAASNQITHLLFEEAHVRSREAENWPQLKEWAFQQASVYERRRYPALILIEIPR